MAQYRVVEYCGTFTIQIYAYEVKGFLWWRRKVWDWEPVNYRGSVRQVWPTLDPRAPNFNSLEAAKQQIKDWNTDPIFHQVDQL
jgi:hypothetical protein